MAADEQAGGTTLPDGLEALRRELKLGDVMSLIERTARWVDPETFRLLPVWYPEHARGGYFYKNNWSQPLINKNRQTGREEHKREANSYANKALTKALGLRSLDRTNWSCCHIWGVDDVRFQESNLIVRHHSFYSCVANMVLLPTPLKAFTDTMLEVKAMLRICARNLYGWQCDHESAAAAVEIIDRWNDWKDYPKSWPRTPANCLPFGVMKLNTTIKRSAERRLARIRFDLANAGPHYPRDVVTKVLTDWKVLT